MDTNSGGGDLAMSQAKSNSFDSRSSSTAAQDTSESINVVVRCRGRNAMETKMKSPIVVDVPSKTGSNQISINTSSDFSLASKLSSTRTYTVDQVYGPGADQSLFFKGAASSLFNQFMQGYNCTIFAYGQTGTGKTYTMCGDLNSQYKQTSETISPNAGLIPRILCKLFENVNYNNTSNNGKENDDDDIVVKCSFVEIYNEELKDLLSNSKVPTKLRIFEQKRTNSSGYNAFGNSNNNNGNGNSTIRIDGLEEFYIKNEEEGLLLLRKGMEERKTAATKMNDLSSRSHTIFTITLLRKKDKINGNEYQLAKMNLVDLAGSENINRSGAMNQRAKEAGAINQSLLTLGRVINALVDGVSYIPYRESKLTRLLQDSLGGKTKTLLVANVSPSSLDCQATISTLDYAAKAKNIKNTAQIGQSVLKNVLLKDFADEISRLKLDLNATRSKDGFFMNESNFKELMIEHENFKSEIEELKRSKETMAKQLSIANSKNEENDSLMLQKTNAIKALESEKEDLLTKFDLFKSSDFEMFNKTQGIIKMVSDNIGNLRLIQSQSENFIKEKIEKSLNPLSSSIQQLIADKENDNIELTKSLQEIADKITKNLTESITGTLDELIKKATENCSNLDKFQQDMNDSHTKMMSLIDINASHIQQIDSNNEVFNDFLNTGLFNDSTNLIQSFTNANCHKINEIAEGFKQQLLGVFNESLINGSKYVINHTKLNLGAEQQKWNQNSSVLNSNLTNDHKVLSSELSSQSKIISGHISQNKQSLNSSQVKINQLSKDLKSFSNDTNDINSSVTLINSTINDLQATREKLFNKLETVDSEISNINKESTHLFSTCSEKTTHSKKVEEEVNRFAEVLDSKIKNYESEVPSKLQCNVLSLSSASSASSSSTTTSVLNRQYSNLSANDNPLLPHQRSSSRSVQRSRSTSSANEDLYTRLSRSPKKTPSRQRRPIALNSLNPTSSNNYNSLSNRSSPYKQGNSFFGQKSSIFHHEETKENMASLQRKRRMEDDPFTVNYSNPSKSGTSTMNNNNYNNLFSGTMSSKKAVAGPKTPNRLMSAKK